MMDCSDPRAVITFPPYTGPEPESGATTSTNWVTLLPAGGTTGTTTDDFAAIWTTCPPATEAGVVAVPVAIRTEAALPGADSTSWVRPAGPAGLAARTPCWNTGPALTARAPTPPGWPPASRSAATIGTVDVIDSAPEMPARDGSGRSDTDPPSRSIPVPPVGW